MSPIPFHRQCAVVLSAVALISLCGCGPGDKTAATSNPPPPPTVVVVHPHRGPIARSVVLPATIRPYQQATLYAKVAGYLKTISVDRGDKVRAGDFIAEIEAPELVADAARYRAEVEVAKADYTRLAEALKKAPDLVVPLAVDTAKGKLDIAEANQKRNDTLLSYARITAPFDGAITKRWVDPGALIPAATSSASPQSAAVVTLVDFSKVRIEAAIPEPEVPFLKPGQAAEIKIEELPDRSFPGEVTRIAYSLDDATKTMPVEIELANPDGALRPGMFATVRIVVEKKADALLIPAEALVVEKARTSVFKLVEGKAKKVPVKIGFEDGKSVEIGQGAVADDSIIVTGKLQLTDGQPVNAAK